MTSTGSTIAVDSLRQRRDNGQTTNDASDLRRAYPFETTIEGR